MHDMIGSTDHTKAFPQDSDTGPVAKASTAGGMCGFDIAQGRDCSATITLRITHNQVIATAQLDMGGQKIAQRVFERRKGSSPGWVLARGNERFSDEADWISAELAAFADRLPFPFAVANMLPGAKASSKVVAQAAREVANG
ncbi:hypothetical protein [Stenotrophomonas maltophilia]|uniref:hypothetical protein n=1 Tax=Stenotrophomonas maltophilia TaxID=40324 RepID=UPI0006AA4E8E|nr:hypothetical protein [Stenotrophomonas maltophilia]